MRKIEFGIYTLGDHVPDAKSGIKVSEKERMEEFILTAKLAEKYGFDFYSLGESHQEHFISQAHAVILGAIARETNKIRLASSATIISTSDPVRVYENFATLDLLSGGRMEIVAGRASRIGLFELLGYSLRDYEALFEERFEMLLQLFEDDVINWSGKYRKPLKDMVLYPKPMQDDFPIWRAVGGNKGSAYLAGRQGVPMALAMLAGSVHYYHETMEAYRKMFKMHHPEKESRVGANTFLYIGDTDEEAFKTYYQYVNQSMKMANGNGFSKEAYMSVLDYRNVMLVGSKELIIKKLVYQFKTFKHDRHFFQVDLGGMPFKEVQRMIQVLGEEIIPTVRKILEEEEL